MLFYNFETYKPTSDTLVNIQRDKLQAMYSCVGLLT